MRGNSFENAQAMEKMMQKHAEYVGSFEAFQKEKVAPVEKTWEKPGRSGAEDIVFSENTETSPDEEAIDLGAAADAAAIETVRSEIDELFD